MHLGDITDRINFIQILNNKDSEVTGISCDTKTLRDGEIYVCIKGNKTDGHKFAKEAAKKASAIIAEEETGVDDIPVIMVENSRIALAEAAAVYYGNPASGLKIIGVTGTNGKTSVAIMIKNLLEQCGYNVGLIGTVFNMIGDKSFESTHTTPDPVSLNKLFSKMAEQRVNYVVMEVSSHAISQERIYGIEFAAGVLTNITPEHLDYHKTMKEYALVKSRLFEKSAISIINGESGFSEYIKMPAEGRVITYGTDSRSYDVRATEILTNINGISFRVNAGKEDYRISSPMCGDFMVDNALAAAAVAYALDIPSGFVRMAFKKLSGITGRMERLDTGKAFDVFIDYAHTPDGLLKVISSLNKYKEGRLITVFGCGGERDSLKRPVMGKTATDLSDFVIITSDNPRGEKPEDIISDILNGVEKENFRVIPERKKAIEEALLMAKPGDVVLLAGKGHETIQITNEGEIHFDEREIVRELLWK